MPATKSRADVPTGDTDETTTEQGSLYADPGIGRLVRLSNPENHDGYRVELWIAEPDGDITNHTVVWTHDEVTQFVELDYTEYLAGHCFDGHSPYGVWHNYGRHNCPECGKFMEPGFYHGGGGQTARKFYPGLVCPDNHGRTGHCPGHMDYETLRNTGGYITAREYVEQRFRGDA